MPPNHTKKGMIRYLLYQVGPCDHDIIAIYQVSDLISQVIIHQTFLLVLNNIVLNNFVLQKHQRSAFSPTT